MNCIRFERTLATQEIATVKIVSCLKASCEPCRKSIFLPVGRTGLPAASARNFDRRPSLMLFSMPVRASQPEYREFWQPCARCWNEEFAEVRLGARVAKRACWTHSEMQEPDM